MMNSTDKTIMYNQTNGQIIPRNVNELSFDSFDRDPSRDIVCVAPVRTIIRREEEVLLVRRVRKIEDIDAGPACPVSQQS
ncbi:hypothetical protein C7B61_12265 [filamentous cyanobacterium CCP1]|nr:hypothetical protein C7B76_22535 [filamentous cyanobacterium CCP2]PSB64401.1 hypothetical protein C7B61_12265 [filamentous cyanobacterium CCP1]